MASISCPNPLSPCFDNSSPFQNISSEAPDQNVIPSCYAGYFGSRSYGRSYSYVDRCGELTLGAFATLNSGGPATGTPGVAYPPLGSDWDQQTGGGWCISTESQTEADLCAMRQGEDANSENWPTVTQDPVTGLPIVTPQEKFPNQAQTCTVECADGTPFTFTVAQGKFLAESTDVANAMAYSFACRQAQINRVCLITLSLGGGCVGQQYSGSVIAAGTATFYTMTIPSGTLPPGITYSLSSLNESFAILFAGVPTTTGSYTFTVRAEDIHGNFMQKDFTIAVLEITTASLPNASSGSAYSQTIVTAGGTSPYTYVLTGSLPPGLSLSDSGTISGTVTSGTDAAIYGFEVTATDSASNSCLKHFTIEVTSSCPDWGSLLWQEDINSSAQAWTPGPGGVSAAFSTTRSSPPANNLLLVRGITTYNTDQCNCTFHFNINSTGDYHASGTVYYDPGTGKVVLAFIDWFISGNGNHSANFSVPDTGGNTWSLEFEVQIIGSAGGTTISGSVVNA